MDNNSSNEIFFNGLKRISNYFFYFLMIVFLFIVLYLGGDFPKEEKIDLSIYSMNYDINTLPETKTGKEIKHGYKIFNETYLLLGETSLESPFVGNSLSCTNCHLNGGTQPFAMPLIGVDKRFPQYRGREDIIGSLEDRINGCFERSMNGIRLKNNSTEMIAIVSYINWLGRYVRTNEVVAGKGLKSIEYPDRKVDLVKGEVVFKRVCVECHGADGQGQKIDQYTYLYPPLWGSNSYNNGAGMTRVLTAATFIKYNMPQGTTFESPILTDEESYDVAGFINKQLRPLKKNLKEDFPDLKKKPMSTPYPPYVDSFSQSQHQLGPFQPIFDFYKTEYNIKKSK
jgi:thiosulfate dehydrogenase